MDVDARAFGQMEGKVNALQVMLEEQNKVLAKQSEVIEKMASKLGEMDETLSQAKGSWRTLIWISGAVAGLAGGLAWIFQHISFKG